jgi:colanic acid/amylovoran biosynthesis protein
VVGGDTPLVLFSVREWNQSVSGGDFSYDAYAQSMRKVAEKFIERGWRCRAVSTCQGVEGYTVDDSKTARHIFQGLDVEVDAAFHTPQELMNVLRSAQLVIATRMHMAIMSLITRTPVIAIAYETKSTELFNSIGAASSVVAIENVDDDWVTKVTSSEDLTSSAAILDAELLAALSADAGKPAEAVARASGLLR